jgi:hypothetical protein
MFPMTTNMAGDCFAFPDVCNTPSPVGPVPIPYPNMAMLVQGNIATFSSKVKVLNMNAATVKSEILMSMGDEPGVAGGVISARFKGPAKFKLGSTKVFVEGAMVAHHMSMIAQNGVANSNIPPGLQVSPSQPLVTVMP